MIRRQNGHLQAMTQFFPAPYALFSQPHHGRGGGLVYSEELFSNVNILFADNDSSFFFCSIRPAIKFLGVLRRTFRHRRNGLCRQILLFDISCSMRRAIMFFKISWSGGLVYSEKTFAVMDNDSAGFAGSSGDNAFFLLHKTCCQIPQDICYHREYFCRRRFILFMLHKTCHQGP